MRDKTVRFIAFTAMGIALVILAQLLGSALPAGFTVVGPFTGKQLLTGSLVNCVLFVFTGAVGVWSGVIIGLLSSLLAYLFGIGPILPVVPVVIRAAGVPAKQAAALSIMFSWPQGPTALIGGALALVILGRLHQGAAA